MARKYALINNNVVSDIVLIESEDISNYYKTNQLVIDIEDFLPQPTFGWVLNGNKLEIPQGLSDREQFEYHLAIKKLEFGTNLVKHVIGKIGARNKILNKTSIQITALMNQLLPVKFLLETGALATARDACSQLKFVYTEYSDIFNEIIAEINHFEINHGL